MNRKLKAYLQLMRPANIVTSVADILLGFAVSGAFIHFPDFRQWQIQVASWIDLIALILSTIGLYGGGVVLNDYFDAKLDASERPERPIPSGIISKKEALVQGVVLLLFGCLCAFTVSALSGCLAITIACLTVWYNAINKHYAIAGPINMGACRAFNLLLGISVVQGSLLPNWYLCIIPLVYIGAITSISQGEVHGGNRQNLIFGLMLYTMVILFIMMMGWLHNFNIMYSLPFLGFFAYQVFRPVVKALSGGATPGLVIAAVKMGVISIILLDAAIAAGYTGILYGLLIVCLLPVSRFLARYFSVT